jgi:hypothetical protein
MSSMPAVADRPLVGDEWVEFEDFETAIGGELARSGLTELSAEQADADFAAMMRAQDVPLVRSSADAAALRELLRRPPPARRPLPRPLPLDE